MIRSPRRQREGDLDAGEPASRVPLFDDALLTRLRAVILHSRQAAMTGLTGEHRSLRKGLSPEFADFKPYSEGDDFRRVDWNAYARFESLVVRESETTTEFDVHLLLDVSRSMDWSSDPDIPTKLRFAAQLAGALGYLSLWHFDRVAITPVGSNADRPFGPVQGRANIVPMLRYLERIRPVSEIDLSQAIRRYVHLRRRPGLLMIVSDMLSGDVAGLESAIQGGNSRGWQTALLHVQDPAEEDPALLIDATHASELIDLETGDRLRVRGDASSLTTYHRERQEWLDRLARIGETRRAVYVPLRTDEPLERIVLGVLRTYGLVV